MADYSDAISKAKAAGYSDSEIANFLADKEPGIAKARSAGYDDKEILGHLGGAAPAAPQGDPQPTSPTAGVAEDVGAGVTSGNAQGTAKAIGLPGDLATLLHSVAPQGVIDRVKNIPGAQFVYNHLPSSQAVMDFAAKTKAATAGDPSTDVPLNYVPNSTAGQLAQTGVSNATSGLLTGSGPVGAAGMGVGAAAGKYLGGDMGEAIGGLAGGLGAPLALARASRQAITPLKDAATIKAESDAAYKTPLLRDSTVTPGYATNAAGAMRHELETSGSPFFPAQANRVTDGVERLAGRGAPTQPQLTELQRLEMEMNGFRPPSPTPAQPVSIAELNSFRKELGKFGQEKNAAFQPTEQAAAAGVAKRVLDSHLNNITPADVVSGDPAAAVSALREAQGNWHAYSNAKTVGDLIGNAINSNNTVGSARNLGNKIRQAFNPLLKNDAAKINAMGRGDDIVDLVRNVTTGDAATNALREASNRLGGGGGIAGTMIGHGIANAAGGATMGPVGQGVAAVLASIPGSLLRAAANQRTLKAARGVQDAILATAPANARIVAANRAARAANKAAKERAITQGIPAAALMLSKFNGR